MQNLIKANVLLCKYFINGEALIKDLEPANELSLQDLLGAQ